MAASKAWQHLAGIHTPEGTDQGPKSYPALSLLMARDPKWQAQPTDPFGGKGARREPGQGLKWAWMAGGDQAGTWPCSSHLGVNQGICRHVGRQKSRAQGATGAWREAERETRETMGKEGH